MLHAGVMLRKIAADAPVASSHPYQPRPKPSAFMRMLFAALQFGWNPPLKDWRTILWCEFRTRSARQMGSDEQ